MPAPAPPWAACTGPGVTACSSTHTAHRCPQHTGAHVCERTAELHTLHSFTCTHASLLLPFWYQGRNQGQGTLAVLLGIVSGQHENLSKVRLQTSSAEGQEDRKSVV